VKDGTGIRKQYDVIIRAIILNRMYAILDNPELKKDIKQDANRIFGRLD